MQQEMTWLKRAFICHSYFNTERAYIIIQFDLTCLKWKNESACSISGSLRKSFKISSVYSQCIFTGHHVKKWFSKFDYGDTSLGVEPKPRSSSDLDQDALRELVKCNPLKSTRKLALNLNITSHNLQPLKKDRKNEKAERFGPSHS